MFSVHYWEILLLLLVPVLGGILPDLHCIEGLALQVVYLLQQSSPFTQMVRENVLTEAYEGNGLQTSYFLCKMAMGVERNMGS